APGLAGRDAQVDQLAPAEQRQVAGGQRELVPLEALADDQRLALIEALLARCGADRVGRFEHEQGLVAMQDVERRERAFEVSGKLFRAQDHGRTVASRRTSWLTMSRSMSSYSSTSSRLAERIRESSKLYSRRTRMVLAGRSSLPAASSTR